MRVRFTHKMGYYMPGEVHDLAPEIAERALYLNRAERVSETETATRRPPENAATRTKRPDEEPEVCGADTDGGGTCQRQVKSGRCWQHSDD